MDVNGETLRVSRLRNAVLLIQGEHDDNYAGKDIFVEMGPKPSIGRRLKHVVEIYGKGKVSRHHAYLDTRDGMVAVVTSYHEPAEDDADGDNRRYSHHRRSLKH